VRREETEGRIQKTEVRIQKESPNHELRMANISFAEAEIAVQLEHGGKPSEHQEKSKRSDIGACLERERRSSAGEGFLPNFASAIPTAWTKK